MIYKFRSIEGLALLAVVFALCFGAGMAAHADPYAVIDIQTLKNQGRLKPLVEVVIADDPAYGKKKRYMGYPLEALLRTVPDIEKIRKAGGELVFHCADGYTPVMSLDDALKKRGVIAVRDLNAPKGKDWMPVMQGGKTVSPAPFYLVWEGVSHKDKRYHWPYELQSISVMPYMEYYTAAVPRVPKTSVVYRGMTLFKTRCLMCHTVNLVGGTVGPELNVPHNVTEYWKEGMLRQFIRNAPGFRARSGMPAFGDLSEMELNAILAYLRTMKGAKICGENRPCPQR
ncbi:MAG: cytochrome c [Thermodesulfobacteriota bacterium]